MTGDVERPIPDTLFSIHTPILEVQGGNAGRTGATSGSSEFDRLRAYVGGEPGVRSEVESALQILIDRVDPADRGARFVVGTAVEWIVAAAAWAAGVLANPGGHSVDGFDLQDVEREAKSLWSVKSSFRREGSVFRITNGLGGAGRGLTDPTVFLHPRLPGAVLVHPDVHADVSAHVAVKADGTDLKLHPILEHAQGRPECVVALRMPSNEHRGSEDPALLFTKALLVREHFPRLSRVFADAEATSTTLSEEIRQLAGLRDEGILSEAEYALAKARLLR